jgi:hypothetical protein
VAWEGLGKHVGFGHIPRRFPNFNDRIPSDDWDGMYIFAGPHTVIRCYEDATTTHLPKAYIDDDGPYTDFLTRALSEIAQERQVTERFGGVGVILDDIIGEHDRCTIHGLLRIHGNHSNSSEQAVTVVGLASQAF